MNTQRHNRPPPQTVISKLASMHSCHQFTDAPTSVCFATNIFTTPPCDGISTIKMDNHPFVDDAKNIPC
ncbi:hypothetical protein BTUL_0077g00160 [Botrytis tulipae]|uniref:Uncharacterized protein n=1 Tax=Botrytis tulipae TaxID=87230 RepID=A0A4Z1EKW5_9HELO|nr:hypothetical protein EAF00_004052 [Botryotinia globosa]TGO13064.1 hypothetical protein BTUL_0077g00160 [Botrytis tulipae]